MSIFDELTNEIQDWITQGQDPESIKKDLVETIDKALRKAPQEKYKPDLIKVLRYYMRDAYGEEVAKAYSDKEYESMADAIFSTIDEAMESMPTYAKAVLQLMKEAKTATESVKAKTKVETKTAVAQEDTDSQIIENFLKDLNKKNKEKASNDDVYTYADDFHMYFGIK